MYKNVPSCLCCLEFRLCAAVVFFLVAIYLCAGVKENACVQSAVTRNSLLKQNKLKWELPGQKKHQIIHEGTTCRKTWLFAMLALAAAWFCKRALATTSPSFGDNSGKTAPDASICSLKLIFTAQTPAVSSPVIKFDCPMYKKTKGVSVLYEPEGDHLGWLTSSCPIFHSPNVQLHTICQVLLSISPLLNVSLVSHKRIISALCWWLFVYERLLWETVEWSYSSRVMDIQGLDRSSGSFTHLTDKWRTGCIVPGVILSHTDLQGGKNHTWNIKLRSRWDLLSCVIYCE